MKTFDTFRRRSVDVLIQLNKEGRNCLPQIGFSPLSTKVCLHKLLRIGCSVRTQNASNGENYPGTWTLICYQRISSAGTIFGIPNLKLATLPKMNGIWKMHLLSLIRMMILKLEYGLTSNERAKLDITKRRLSNLISNPM